MYENDTILRMLSQMEAFLEKVAGLTKKDQLDEAQALVEKTAVELLNLDLQTMEGLSYTNLIQMVNDGSQNIQPLKTNIAAKILEAYAGVLQRRRETLRAEQLRTKAFCMLLLLFERDTSLTEERDYLLRRGSEIPVAVLDYPSLMRLFAMFEFCGAYGCCEDLLFDMLAEDDLAPRKAELANLGFAFYTRMLALEDEALQRGNLPRTEVEVGFAQFLARVRTVSVEPGNWERII
ncbi:DUF6483 family protein [Luoshenia tenuis]|jgi:hypothetical protein|uniref:DUF6483 family protein n=1 Tax=Luoshenia tenuis TaxID=2763654 RepID=UPI003D90B139